MKIYEPVARDHPKPNTLNYKRDGSWHSISAAEMLHARAAHRRSDCIRSGVRKGDRVALLSESCVEWMLTDQGCMFAGAITVPIYPTLTPPQVTIHPEGLRRAGPVHLSHEKSLLQMREVLARLSGDCSMSSFLIRRRVTPVRLSLAELEQRGRALTSAEPQLIDELARRS